MKNFIISYFFLSLPIFVFASGGNILYYFFYEIMMITVTLVFILLLKINLKKKIFMIFILLISSSTILYIFKDIPYTKNKIYINLISIIIPILSVIISYQLLTKKN